VNIKEPRLSLPVSADDHSEGRADAPVTMVEYGDYECPHCGHAYPIIKRVQARLGPALRFVFRNFPLSEAHPHALAAAELAEAAATQGKFWPMHDTLFEHQTALDDHHLAQYAKSLDLNLAKLKATLESDEPKQRVRSDFMSGVRSGVNGTPTFFINGSRFDGNWTDEDEFVEALQSAAR